MMHRWFACFAIIILSCCLTGISALDDAKQPASEEEVQKSKFQVETELMEVRTVVTDKNGRIVEDLKKEDFELLENKVSQEIGHFSVSKVEEERPNVPAGDRDAQDRESKLEQARERLSHPPVRTVLLYVDALHLSFTSLNWVKQTLNRFIDEQLTDRDLVAFTSSETLGVAQQFTRDRKILRYAAGQIRYNPANRETLFTPNLAAEFLDERTGAVRLGIDIMRREENIVCPCTVLRNLAYHKASQILTDAAYARENTLSIIEHFARQMTDLPGKRMIVIFSDGFTLYNRIGDLQNDLVSRAVNRAIRSGTAIYSINASGVQTPPAIDAAIRSAARDAGYEALVQCLKGCDSLTNEDDRNDCKEECVKKHTISLSCLEDIDNYNNPACEYPEPGELDAYLDSSEMEKLNGLYSLAVETGGKMYDKDNDLNIALGRALEDNRFFYVLSYYPAAGKDTDKFRRIEVRVRDHPEYTVRTPRGFWTSSIKDKLEADAANTPQERLVQAMRSPLPVTDLGVSARADFIETEADDKQVSLGVYFEGDRFQYRDQGQGGVVELEIMSVIYDSSGNQVDGISAHVTGNLTHEDLEQAKTGGYRFSRRLPLKPGFYQARIGVREEGTNRMGTATTWVEVPELNPDTLEMSSLILSNPLDINPVDTEGMGVRELEQIKMIQGVPMYARDDIFYYSFRVHRNSPATAGSGLSLMRELLRDGDPVRTEEWQPVSKEQEDTDSKGWLDLDGELDIGTLDPGVYELRISVKADQSDEAVQRTVAFGIL
jgi:VWFA-related protein